MKEVILIRFGEIFLKGRNYSYFENTLFKNVERRLKRFNLKLERISGRFLVSDFEAEDKDDIIEAIQTVFGLVSLSVAYEVETSVDTIKSACEKIKLQDKTFKVEVKRADKTFPIKSFEFAGELGVLFLKTIQMLRSMSIRHKKLYM